MAFTSSMALQHRIHPNPGKMSEFRIGNIITQDSVKEEQDLLNNSSPKDSASKNNV